MFTSYGMDGAKYELTITRTTKKAALAFTPAAGDTYTLIITSTEGVTKTSTGQITDISDKTFTLKQTGTSETFAVTVSANSSGGGTIVSFTGDIPINNSSEKTQAPSELTPNQTPLARDYDIGNMVQSVDSVTAVTITPKAGKSSGARTIYYAGAGNTTYTKSKTLPTEKGTYAVTFDVAAATGWNAATGLSAGELEINTNKTPKLDDYEIGNLAQSVGSVKAVTITPKSGASPGTVSNIKYAGSATLPTTAGTYAVTFDVAAATGWNAVTGLSAGNLVLTTTQPLTVTITGTPAVGKLLTADVQKNISGVVKYQWMRGTEPIDNDFYERNDEYYPKPMDSGKKISVKVKCEGETAESAAVTIPLISSYTVTIERHNWSKDFVSVVGITIPGMDGYYNSDLNNLGFKFQWQRNNTDIPGATGENYALQAEDAGKTIRAKVTLNSTTVYSNGISIPSFKGSDDSLAETNWSANFTYNKIYFLSTLVFSGTAWTMTIKASSEEQLVSGTYTVTGNDIVLYPNFLDTDEIVTFNKQ